MMLGNQFALNVVNPAILSGPQSVLYQGVSATLNLTLVNNSGSSVTIPSGAGNGFQIFFPTFFLDTEIQTIVLTPPQGWTQVCDPKKRVFSVTWTGQNPFEWTNGNSLLFVCTDVGTAAQPASTGWVQVNRGLHQVPASLTVIKQPPSGNLDLRKALQPSLDAQGGIYVSSSSADTLPNTLFLTLRNIIDPPQNLFTGANQWKNTPQVKVSFLYGSSPGALAPDDGNNTGSAWGIEPSLTASQGNNWIPAGPAPSGDNSPEWTLTPQSQNPEILGAGAQASITFSFAQIVSITPVGHTQMILRFSNFPANDTQNYDDCVFVLDIVKQSPPATRGLVNFYGKTPLIAVRGPEEPVSIQLNWARSYVDTAVLICSFPGMAPVTFPYPKDEALGYDSTTIVIPGVTISGPIFFTLQSFNGFGDFLNALQYTVWVESSAFIDPRNNKSYMTRLVGGLCWMTQNLDWNAPGSFPYDQNPDNDSKFGRLYLFSDAAQAVPQPDPPPPPPPPWRLPSLKDWQSLIAAAGQDPFTALMPGGVTGFNAQLGGEGDNFKVFSDAGHAGNYWTADQSSPQSVSICRFSNDSKTVNLTNTRAANCFMSVRYVRNP